MELRGYQLDILDGARKSLRTKRSVLIVSPTGSGKTVLTAAMVLNATAKGKIVWIVVHRNELIKQISKTLHRFGIPHGIVKAGVPETTAMVQICMINTLANRLTRMQQPDLLIIDECHHTPASQYTKVISFLPRTAKIIGLTASPERRDGKGLGQFFEEMVMGPSVAELINLGSLVPAHVYVPARVDTRNLHTKYGDVDQTEARELMTDPAIVGDAVGQWEKYALMKRTLTFCQGVAHAEQVAAEYRRQGYAFQSIDGTMTEAEREDRLSGLDNGKYIGITSSDLIGEGVDIPSIECVQFLRITYSLPLYVQQAGRGMRIDLENGKTHCIILDHVQNTLRFGLPDCDRIWSLNGRKAREKATDDDPALNVKTCSKCLAAYTQSACPYCGDEAAKSPREIEQIEGELARLNAPRKYLQGDEWKELGKIESLDELKAFCFDRKLDEAVVKNSFIQRAKSLQDLLHVQKVLNYALGWAKHRYVARHGETAYQQAHKAMIDAQVVQHA